MLQLSVPDLPRRPRQVFQVTLPGQRVSLLTLLTLPPPAAKLLLSLPQAFQLTLPAQRELLLTLLTLQSPAGTLPIGPGCASPI
jgi:hypothetical protein